MRIRIYSHSPVWSLLQEECEDLRQLVKKGLFKRPTVVSSIFIELWITWSKLYSFSYWHLLGNYHLSRWPSNSNPCKGSFSYLVLPKLIFLTTWCGSWWLCRQILGPLNCAHYCRLLSQFKVSLQFKKMSFCHYSHFNLFTCPQLLEKCDVRLCIPI